MMRLSGVSLSGLIFNYDDSEFFSKNPPIPMNGQAVDDRIDLMARAGVTIFMCNINAQRANYASSAFEPFWSGFDPQAGDDQPFLADMAPEDRPGYRKMCENMLALHNQGVDYAARVISRCRHNGISPWISLRMNDIHWNDRLQHPIHSAFWKENHSCWRVPDRRINYFDRAMDYSQESVRNRHLALVKEALARYDSDGLELDFMRAPYLFRPGYELEGGKILTEWLAQVRQLAVQAGQKRGHPVKLGVRVPVNPVTAYNLGLDAVLWVQCGLVDLVTVAPWFDTMDSNIPWFLWKRLLSPYPVTLAAGLEINAYSYPGGPGGVVDPETAVGAAIAALHGGADIIYLFNYYQTSWCKNWPPGKYESTLRAMSSIRELDCLSRRHMVTFRDVLAPGELADHPLPATGSRLFFRLQTGPRPVGRTVTATIGLQSPVGPEPEAPELRVNGVVCSLQTQQDGVFTFKAPDAALADVVQLLEVSNNKPITANRIELDISGATPA
ncbi:MAG: family 10 glycosylhydrolase [Kiritimatiellae bacterium]|nr:hypothetical protein [Verrucomicrobiota bacterium]MBU4366669.1 hypothetical protein [Verrucomicrobiota bacterium]MCG2660870.1 family 10 glycosylhydrolase [Kiritimatiellia bacterium]